jgi:hypothetical protein
MGFINALVFFFALPAAFAIDFSHLKFYSRQWDCSGIRRDM